MSRAQLKLGADGKRAKSKRVQRAMENRAPKVNENIKRAMFLKGPKSSEITNGVLRDLAVLKKPNAVLLMKKNLKRPFEDESEVQFLSTKNDCSLFMFGSHSKKRPHNLVMGRCFDNQVLDMMELSITRFVPIEQFPANKSCPMLGSKPCFIFKGVDFDYKEDCRKFANITLDFFRGIIVQQINLEGLDHVIVCTAIDGIIYWRHYAVLLKRVQGSKLPLVKLEEVGPSIDFKIGRTKFAAKDLFKAATRMPSEGKPRKEKNITTTPFAKMGTVHKGRQDLGELQTRKMKGLKRKRGDLATTTGEDGAAAGAAGTTEQQGTTDTTQQPASQQQQQQTPEHGSTKPRSPKRSKPSPNPRSQ